MSLSFLAAPDTARAQEPFPMGLELEYDLELDWGYLGSSDSDWEFQVLGYTTDPNILLIRTRTDSASWTEGYVDVTTWEITDQDGDGYDIYFTPPQWMTVATLIVGTEVEITYITVELDFVVLVDTMVTVPAGTLMCKHLRYTDSDITGDYEIDFYYETTLGILVKYTEDFDSVMGSDFDSSYDCELKSSNMSQYLLFGMPPLLFIGIVAGVIIVVVVVVIIVVVLKKRSGGV